MHISTLLQTATLALSLTAAMGVMSTAFADVAHAAQQQTQNQVTNANPYDSPNFVVPSNDIY